MCQKTLLCTCENIKKYKSLLYNSIFRSSLLSRRGICVVVHNTHIQLTSEAEIKTSRKTFFLLPKTTPGKYILKY